MCVIIFLSYPLTNLFNTNVAPFHLEVSICFLLARKSRKLKKKWTRSAGWKVNNLIRSLTTEQKFWRVTNLILGLRKKHVIFHPAPLQSVPPKPFERWYEVLVSTVILLSESGYQKIMTHTKNYETILTAQNGRATATANCLAFYFYIFEIFIQKTMPGSRLLRKVDEQLSFFRWKSQIIGKRPPQPELPGNAFNKYLIRCFFVFFFQVDDSDA